MKRLLVIAAMLATTVPAWGAASDEASRLRGPVPTAPVRDWLADRDDPGRASWTDVAGAVHFALSVSARGNVIECLVERSSGSTQLDETICGRLRQRANFRPAVDGSGKPVLGMFRGDSAGPGAAADALVEMAIALKSMPRGLADPTYVDIAISVDQAGRVEGCGQGEALNRAGQPVPARVEAGRILGATACAEAVRALRPNPARNPQGLAGRSVQTARVLFTADVATMARVTTDPAAATAGSGSGALASAAPAAPAVPEGEGDILVVGRQIVGKREATIPYRGFSPIKDFEPIGYELVLLEANGGKWYRAKLVPPCIGHSSMMPINGRQPGMAFVTHADGTFDRFSEVYVRGLPPPYFNGRCEIESLVESASPKRVKAQLKAERLARTANREKPR